MAQGTNKRAGIGDCDTWKLAEDIFTAVKLYAIVSWRRRRWRETAYLHLRTDQNSSSCDISLSFKLRRRLDCIVSWWH